MNWDVMRLCHWPQFANQANLQRDVKWIEFATLFAFLEGPVLLLTHDAPRKNKVFFDLVSLHHMPARVFSTWCMLHHCWWHESSDPSDNDVRPETSQTARPGHDRTSEIKTAPERCLAAMGAAVSAVLLGCLSA